MMTGFRILALCLIVLALLLLGADALSSLQHGGIRLHSLGHLIDAAVPNAANDLRTWAAKHLPAPLASLVRGLLVSWAWALVGGAGVVIAFVSGRPRHRS